MRYINIKKVDKMVKKQNSRGNGRTLCMRTAWYSALLVLGTALLILTGCPELPNVSIPDVVPPAQAVIITEIRSEVGMISFQVVNPNTEEVQVTAFLDPPSDGAEFSINDTVFDSEEGFMLSAASNEDESKLIRITHLNGQEYIVRFITADTLGNTHGTPIRKIATPLVAPSPDLTAHSPSIPHAIVGGEHFDISMEVTNIGTVASTRTHILYHQYANNVTTGPPNSDVQATGIIDTLGAGDTVTDTVTLVAPEISGVYYYVACVESVNTEIYTDNNCSAPVAMTISSVVPDVGVTIAADSTTVLASIAQDKHITLYSSVRNSGLLPSESTELIYYFSEDATLDISEDEKLHAVSIDTLGVEESVDATEVSASVPRDTGIYYYFACVEPVLYETDTSDNCSIALPVSVTLEPFPDLRVQKPIITAESMHIQGGKDITIQATVENSGSAATPESTTLTYYQSSNAVIGDKDDQEIGTDIIEILDSSGNSVHILTLESPSVAGVYYYGACAAPLPDVEASTTNNCSRAAPLVLSPPNLRVSRHASSEMSVAQGDQFTMEIQVQNIGNIIARDGTLHYFQSSDTRISSIHDTEVSTISIDPLAAGESRVYRVDITAPRIGGTYYYGACATGIQANCSAPLTIVIPPSNLTIDHLQIPTPAGGGFRIYVDFTIRTQVHNTGDSYSERTILRYYRGGHPTIRSRDIEIGTKIIPSLAPGQKSAIQTHEVPGDSRAGQVYWYGVCVDSPDSEMNSEDNCSFEGGRVETTNPLFGRWTGKTQGVVVNIGFLEEVEKHTNKFNPPGEDHLDYTCDVTYTATTYTVTACVDPEGDTKYRDRIEGTHGYTLSNNNNTLKTTASDVVFSRKE